MSATMKVLEALARGDKLAAIVKDCSVSWTELGEAIDVALRVAVRFAQPHSEHAEVQKRAPKSEPVAAPNDLVTRVRERIETLKITRRQAADEIGIGTAPYLSSILTGKVVPGPATRGKLQAWLEKPEKRAAGSKPTPAPRLSSRGDLVSPTSILEKPNGRIAAQRQAAGLEP